MANVVNIKNKKALHDYEIIEKYIAGIQLKGTEIKSIRMGKASLVDSYCHFVNGELFVKNMQIAEYRWGTHYNHLPGRERKLLLTGRELKKLEKNVKERGYTIVTLRLYISENGFAKLEIALARGRKEYDKREEMKKKDTQRQLERLSRY
jgi:SsrA-binding protein